MQESVTDLIIVNNDNKPILATDMVNYINKIERQIKQLKVEQQNYKELIQYAMEKKGVIKLKDDISGLTISYTEAKDDIEVFDKDKFREENPDLYDKYVSLDGKKKAYISIRIND